MQMLSVAECKGLTIEELWNQIKIRRDLQTQMVGWLYPRIVEDEIKEIKEIINLQYGPIGVG